MLRNASRDLHVGWFCKAPHTPPVPNDKSSASSRCRPDRPPPFCGRSGSNVVVLNDFGMFRFFTKRHNVLPLPLPLDADVWFCSRLFLSCCSFISSFFFLIKDRVLLRVDELLPPVVVGPRDRWAGRHRSQGKRRLVAKAQRQRHDTQL